MCSNILLVSIIALLVIGVLSITISYLTGSLKPEPTYNLKQDEADELQRKVLKTRLKESAKSHKSSVRTSAVSTPRRITTHNTTSSSDSDSDSSYSDSSSDSSSSDSSSSSSD